MIASFASWVTYSVLKQVPGTQLADSMEFFVYDSVKILLLILVITHAMSLLRYYLPVKKIRTFLVSRNFYGTDYFLATVFGSITPFCSCSSIPLFIGFLEAGIPLGVTFAFLITSPLINEVAVVLFVVMFGWKITFLYVVSGMFIGMFGGYLLGKLNLERYIMEYSKPCCCKNKNGAQINKTMWRILLIISKRAMHIFWTITPYVLVGVAVGSIIHGYVPTGFFEGSIATESVFAVPIAVIVAVPMYANASSVIPIVESIVSKGIPLGTALAFMMAVVGISLPEALILKRVMKLPLLAMFFAVVSVGIMAIGYLFNLIL